MDSSSTQKQAKNIRRVLLFKALGDINSMICEDQRQKKIDHIIALVLSISTLLVFCAVFYHFSDTRLEVMKDNHVSNTPAQSMLTRIQQADRRKT